MDIFTKLHRAMRHISDHISDLDCIQRVISKENETLHKQFKRLVDCTNQYIDTIGTQLLSVWTSSDDTANPITDDEIQSDDDDYFPLAPHFNHLLLNTWTLISSQAKNEVERRSAFPSPAVIFDSVPSFHDHYVSI